MRTCDDRRQRANAYGTRFDFSTVSLRWPTSTSVGSNRRQVNRSSADSPTLSRRFARGHRHCVLRCRSSTTRREPYDGPSRDEVLALRQQYLTPGLITYYRDPLLVVEGHMQYVWDETGKRYLDAFAGIVTVSVGHCHPKIVEKVREQVGKLQHTTTIYLHPTIGQLGQEAGRAHAGRARRGRTSPTPAARRTRSPSSRPASSPATRT